MARRNWIILAGLLAGSLGWKSLPVTLGVLAGGLTAIIGFFWLKLSLLRMLTVADHDATRRFRFSYIIRLGALAATLFFLVAVARVNLIALAAGLSVVLLNIFWTTFRRSF